VLDTTENPIGGPTTTLRTIRENFAVISGFSVVIGLGLSITFLSAYLAVFDWHLLWYIQYTDIITFGLIAIGTISTSFISINWLVQGVLNLKLLHEPSEWKRAWKGPTAFVLFWILLYAGQMYLEHLKPEPHYQYITSAWFSIIAAVSLPTTIALYTRYGIWPTIGQMTGIMVAAVFGTLSFGQWLGGSILYFDKFDQDVFAKNETVKDAKVIAVLSRHTLVMKDKVIYAFPTADVLKFATTSSKNNTPTHSPGP